LPNIPCDYKSFFEPIAKILFCSEDGELLSSAFDALLSHELADGFDFVRSEEILFEVLPKGVHKGLALERLSEHLGIDIRRTVAIGDYDNDVGMLKAAGVGVAVANASPKALAAADYITVSNEEHAVESVICALESGKYGF
jgi:hydroxymethylpyrimidine pyrophosphatase-like HAD family hydrolase